MKLINLLETVSDDTKVQISYCVSITMHIRKDNSTRRKTFCLDGRRKTGYLGSAEMRDFAFNGLDYPVHKCYAKDDILCIDVTELEWNH